LEAFYREHHDRIYRYVYRSVRNREDAEDLTAQIFLKVVGGLDETRAAEVTTIWLFQLTRTTIADYWRAYAHAPICSLEALLDAGWDVTMEASSLQNETAVERVQLLLQALPARYQKVLSCRFLLDLSLRETAQRMGITVANVKVLQFRALKCARHLATTVFT
jgi:RNA polymerase sigma-70 factor (ECF subfamily)